MHTYEMGEAHYQTENKLCIIGIYINVSLYNHTFANLLKTLIFFKKITYLVLLLLLIKNIKKRAGTLKERETTTFIYRIFAWMHTYNIPLLNWKEKAKVSKYNILI